MYPPWLEKILKFTDAKCLIIIKLSAMVGDLEVTGMKCLKIINLFTMVGEKFENYWSEMSKYNQFIHHGSSKI